MDVKDKDIRVIPFGKVGFKVIKPVAYRLMRGPHEAVDIIHAIAKKYLGGRLNEALLIIGLNELYEPVGVIELGDNDTMRKVDVRALEIIRAALLMGAHALVVAHNHPGMKNPEPSEQDVKIYHEMSRTFSRFGIPLLDSLIVADTGIYSIEKGESYLMNEDNVKEILMEI